VPGLAHALTTRRGGTSRGPFASLNLGRTTADDPAAVRENRSRVARALAFAELRTLAQVHSATLVREEALGTGSPRADGVVLERPGTLAGVLGADCPLVLLVDPVRRVLALVHSGWRGTAAGIVPAAVRFLAGSRGTDPMDIRAAVGPGPCAAHYEVGPEVAQALAPAVADLDAHLRPGRGDRLHLDLPAAIRSQLRAAGVPDAAVEAWPACSVEAADLFFSQRRDGPAIGRHALVAGWTA
jgi:hypothetical protein